MATQTSPSTQNPSDTPNIDIAGGKLGTFAGVFTPSVLTILGIILFLRLGYVTGSAGIGRALLIIGLANIISILTSQSLAAIATNLRVKGGGDYYLISRTLGHQFGGAIGMVLYLAQSVSVAFYCIGFAEALVAMQILPPWFSPRIIATTATVLREDRDACLAAGMEDYISKPIQVAELVAALSKCQPRLPMKAPQKRSQVVEAPAAEAPVTAVASKVLDPGALKQLRATLGRQADRMLPGLIERFYQDVDRLLGEARQALERGQTDDLRRAAHTLKSTSATFGAVTLSEVARKLEYLARDGVLEGATGLIAQAEAEFAKAKAALDNERGTVR